MGLSFKEVSEILKVLDASACRELVLEIGDARLVVRRDQAGGVRAEAPPAVSDSRPAAPRSAAPPARSDAREAPSPVQPNVPANGEWIDVKAPMTGTFYRAPAPSEPSFVAPGDSVAAGDTLALIEVMKLYTPIEAPIAGEIMEIVGESGELVEFDQVLLRIQPTQEL